MQMKETCNTNYQSQTLDALQCLFLVIQVVVQSI